MCVRRVCVSFVCRCVCGLVHPISSIPSGSTCQLVFNGGHYDTARWVGELDDVHSGSPTPPYLHAAPTQY